MRQQEQQDSHGREMPMAPAADAAPMVIAGDVTNNGIDNTGGRQAKRRAEAPQHVVYDELIGAIDQGTSSTRFLVFEKGTGRLVASSQLEIKRITPHEGWVEIDPNSIMSSVYATMANVQDQLLAKQHQFKTVAPAEHLIDTSFLSDDQHQNQNEDQAAAGQTGRMFLKCIGICNQRESAVVWDSKTGQPLYNVIVWMDNRTKDIVDDMIDSVPGRDFNHLKDKTGLPMSTYFSAFKLRWLIDNVAEVKAALDEKRLLVGTVDSWILWNLTGKHLTDVTNASRTFLMDIETLQWDKSLCKLFKVPMEILPKILSSADDFGLLQFGPFMGTPVTGVIGDQSAALFGHKCLQLGQTKATFGTGCFIMQNIGPGPLNGAMRGVQREAKRGLITTVAFKLKDKPVCYALEGSIKIAGAALTWLRDNVQLIQNYEECDQLVNATTHSAGVFFVPALGGLYSPYWDPNASGLFIGLSQFTRREHLIRATFDSIAFQTNDILSLMRGVTNGLMIDGGLCKSDNLSQILADIVGCDIVRPAMCETSALGAAMVAGCGAGIWDYDSMLIQSSSPAHQTHHYPHESLHYDDNKFSSLLQTKISTGSNGQPSMTNSYSQTAISSNSSDSNKQRIPERRNQQQKQQEFHHHQMHHRRSLRHRDEGRLMRNLDAGGGINDDAGGGGGGGPISSSGAPERLRKLASSGPIVALDRNKIHNRQRSHTSHYRPHQLSSSSEGNRGEEEEEDEAEEYNSQSNAGDECLMASSESDDYDTGTSGLLSAPLLAEDSGLVDIPSVGGTTGATITGSPLPAVIENHIIESAYETPTETTNGNKQASRTLTSLVKSHHRTCCSGYSSGDNFELSTTDSSSALTDSIGLIASTRTDSPVGSQATDQQMTTSGRDSVATCTEDFASGIPTNHHHHHHHHHHVEPSPEINDSSTVNLYLVPSQMGAQLNASGSSVLALIRPIRANNNRNFEADAEDVANEVHEFGSRDSFGENGYVSSTVSFDSFDDNEDDDERGNEADGIDGSVGCDSNADNDVAYYGDDNDESFDHQVGQVAQLNQRDVIRSADGSSDSQTMMSADNGVVGAATNQLNHHNSINHQTVTGAVEKTSVNINSKQHRKKRASSSEKQMDVFQPYISCEHRSSLVDSWHLAVNRSMQWTKVHHEEIRRIDYQRLSSLPISMYVFFSIGLVALSGFLSPTATIFSVARS